MQEVLLVTDMSTWARAVVQALRVAGYRVEVCPSTADALAVLARPQAPRLIITELLEEGIDAFSMLAVMRENPRLRDVRTIVTTAWTDPDLLNRALSLGAETVFVKSRFTLRELLAAVGGTGGRD